MSGLASTTRATDLKNLFSKYGKVRVGLVFSLETVLIRLLKLLSLKIPVKGMQLSKILWDIKEEIAEVHAE